MGTLRFLLALSVVVAHAGGIKRLGYLLLYASTAVQAFYVISGFLITMVLNESRGYQSLGNFYVSRYLRLWPTYFVVSLITLLVYDYNRLFIVLPRLTDLPTTFFILFSNFTLLFQDWFFFLKLTPSGGLEFSFDFTKTTNPLWTFLIVSPSWTLGIELTFYIIAPFICKSWKGTFSLFIFGLTSRLLVSLFIPYSNQWEYRFAPSEMMFFALGGLSYFINRMLFSRFPFAVSLVGYCFLALLVFAIILWSPIFSTIRVPGAAWIYKNMFFANFTFMLAFILGIGPVFYATKNNLFDRWVGELSYPIYICHEPILFSFMGNEANLLRGNFVVWGIVIPVSILLVAVVTIPVDKLRKKYGAHSSVKKQKADQTPLYVQSSEAA